MTDHCLRLLRQHRRLAELAAYPFDFDLDRAVHGHAEPVRLASGGPLEAVAGSGTGGTYFVCADGSLLYADSEGSAGIIGSSVDEALEIMIGLPGWRDLLHLSPADGGTAILARVAEIEEEIREYHGIDEERAELRSALGLPDRSPIELLGMLHTALLRTEPDFLLLNADEGGAYDLLDPHPRPPLWESVRHEVPGDPAAEPLSTWVRLAAEQGMPELARVALIRSLDNMFVDQSLLLRPGSGTDLDPAPLLGLAAEFERLGDLAQAERARGLHASLR
ncbi:hypothetical protein [Streptomyces sp. Ag109_O5-10]|uniref:hypothetical protein n=1 Tax=Streptomyces sp. Ag109_O5-10 TaxID=1855349 RepID=UPI00089CECD2|nr:hypothetical protein [Streptomyces sp. Ag109_O5-10]SEE34936.1 hypothetical protein SAMN05216533_2039 [Streptomyces sp. Ag109_O5-10]